MDSLSQRRTGHRRVSIMAPRSRAPSEENLLLREDNGPVAMPTVKRTETFRGLAVSMPPNRPL